MQLRGTITGVAWTALVVGGGGCGMPESAETESSSTPPDTVYIVQPPGGGYGPDPGSQGIGGDDRKPAMPAMHRPVAAGGSYRGDIKLVQLDREAYAEAPDRSLLIRSTIGEDCFGPIVQVQANGSVSLMVVGQVLDNGFISKKRVFLEALTDSLANLDPSLIQQVHLEIFVTGLRLPQTGQPTTFLLHSIPPGWDIGGGMALQTNNQPSTHHSHFITPVQTPDGAPALLGAQGYDLAWNHGGASWRYARSQTGLTTWEEFLDGGLLHEQPVVGRWTIDPTETGQMGGWIAKIPLGLDYVRQQIQAGQSLSMMLRHEHDTEADAAISADSSMQGEIIAMSENAEDPNSHPRVVITLGDRRHVISPLGMYSEE